MEVKESWGKVNLVAAINLVLFVYVSFCVIFCKGEVGGGVFSNTHWYYFPLWSPGDSFI